MNTLAILVVSLVIIVISSVTAKEPTTLYNEGQVCYLSSVIQSLFYSSPIRRAILQYESNSTVHNCLAFLFFRMISGPSPQHMDVDFLPAVGKAADRNINVGESDDAHAFFVWLTGTHLPWTAPIFEIQTEETLSFAGIVFSKKIIRDSIATHFVLDNPDDPVHFALNGSNEDGVDYDIDPAECKGQENWEEIVECLAEAGITQKTPTHISIERKIINTPNILIIQGKKYKYTETKGQRNRASTTGGGTWDDQVTTKYENSFMHLGEQYLLYSVVTYVPGHYFAHTCVDFTTNSWYKLNDAVATQSTADTLVGKNGFLFFYAKKSFIDSGEWHLPDVTEVGPKYRPIGQMQQFLVDFVTMLTEATKQPFPRDDYKNSDSKPSQEAIVGTLIDME